MTSNIIYTRLNVEMKAGSLAFSDSISLEEGTCLGVHFVVIDTDNPKFPVEIAVTNAQGGIILNPTDYRDFVHTQGGYFNGMKQVNFSTSNNRFFVSINAQKQLTGDLVGQLIFTIQRNEN